MFETYQPNIYGYLILAVLMVLFYLIFFRGLSSKKYKLYKENGSISFKLTRHFFGILPVHFKTYHNVNYKADYYQRETTNEDNVHTRVRINLMVDTNNTSNGAEQIILTLVDSTDLNKVDSITCELSDFTNNPHKESLTIFDGRSDSFMTSLLVFVFVSVFVLVAFSFSYDKLLTFNLVDITVNKLPTEDLDSITGLKDFPKDIPFPKDSEINEVYYNNNRWQLSAKAPVYATDGKELANMLKSALGKHGWQTKNIQDMPLYYGKSMNKQDIESGGAYLIEFRKLSEQRHGDITLIKNEPWEINISVSEE